MSRSIKNVRYVAEGANDVVRMTDLLSKISGFLTTNIPHMVQTNFTDNSVTVKNSLYGYEITINGVNEWDRYPSYSGVSFSMGIGGEYTGNLGYGNSYNYDCDITLISIDDLLYQLKITMYYGDTGFSYDQDGEVHPTTITISFGGFTGSYDGKQYYVSRINGDIQIENMKINGKGITWSAPFVPATEKYMLAPYCWYGVFEVDNFGLALFGESKDKVLYALYGPDGKIVTTDPNFEYVINGQGYQALSSHLIIPMDNPFKALQKPGEVLVWPE